MVLKTTATIVGLFAIIVGVFYIFSSKCHSQFELPIQYLATKSPYVYQHNTLYDFKVNSSTVQDFIPSGCQADKIWIISRHGTRNPGDKLINKMLRDIAVLRDEIIAAHDNVSKESTGGELCESELSSLKSWIANKDLHPSKEKWLVPQGEVELHGIGLRFQQKFPHIFPKQYDQETYKFKYTKTQRAEASAKSFCRGIFGEKEAEKVQYPPALSEDPILRFYKGCPRWKRDVDKNADTYNEQKKFEQTPLFVGMLQKIQKRLGLQRPILLTEVELVHQTCSFETAWDPKKPSPWCSAFDEEDFKILEYRQDLEYYWVDGYGFELTYKHACAPIQDILEQFNSKVNESDSLHKVTAYFTHSGTILKIISHLGLFKDSQPLRSDNFDIHKENRMWRTSFIDKFATNIAFVLFKCSTGESEETIKNPTYKIGTLFQEHPIATPFCYGDWICPFEQFQWFFNETAHSCRDDVADMCKL